MLKLLDGGLYETRDGRRFRVRYNGDTAYFRCEKAARGEWTDEGFHLSDETLDLVRVVEEKRWIPVAQDYLDSATDDEVFRVRRGHLQRLVTRDMARFYTQAKQYNGQLSTIVQDPLNKNRWFSYRWGVAGVQIACHNHIVKHIEC